MDTPAEIAALVERLLNNYATQLVGTAVESGEDSPYYEPLVATAVRIGLLGDRAGKRRFFILPPGDVKPALAAEMRAELREIRAAWD